LRDIPLQQFIKLLAVFSIETMSALLFARKSIYRHKCASSCLLIFLSTAQSDSDFYSIEADASIVRNGKEHKEAASDSGKA